jgi:hypothetical protein
MVRRDGSQASGGNRSWSLDPATPATRSQGTEVRCLLKSGLGVGVTKGSAGHERRRGSARPSRGAGGETPPATRPKRRAPPPEPRCLRMTLIRRRVELPADLKGKGRHRTPPDIACHAEGPRCCRASRCVVLPNRPVCTCRRRGAVSMTDVVNRVVDDRSRQAGFGSTPGRQAAGAADYKFAASGRGLASQTDRRSVRWRAVRRSTRAAILGMILGMRRSERSPAPVGRHLLE